MVTSLKPDLFEEKMSLRLRRLIFPYCTWEILGVPQKRDGLRQTYTHNTNLFLHFPPMYLLLNKHTSINSNDFISQIPRLNHPHHRLRYLIRLSQPPNRYLIRQRIRRPWNHPRLRDQSWRNPVDGNALLRIRRRKPMDQAMQRRLRTRIMRADHSARKPGHTRTKHDPSPPPLHHARQTQLRQQKRRPAVRPPRPLKLLHAHLADLLDARPPHVEPRVVEQDRRLTHRPHNVVVEPPRLVVGRQVRLERAGQDAVLRLQRGYQRFGRGS